MSGINPGDEMQGSIQINTYGYDAIGSITDLTGSAGSTLWLTKYTTEGGVLIPVRMSEQDLYATIMLEGWKPSSANRGNATNLPGPVTFSNFVLTDQDGNNLLSTTPMYTHINTQDWNQANFTDSDNLTVYNRWPTDVTLVNNPHRVNPPVADFSASIYSGSSVIFADSSTGSPFLWLWDFGDSSTSTEQNSLHTYSSPGFYTVNLTVWNAGGHNSSVKLIQAWFTPVSSFNMNVDHGTAPLTVQFNDTSLYTPTTWNWSFGDGTYSTLRNVSHTYTSGGTYNVTLKAGTPGGTNTSAPQIITVYPSSPVANFTANRTNGIPPFAVAFTDTTTGNPTGWNWDFGDGQTSTVQNPVHVYDFRGYLTVSLTATNANGSNTTTKAGYIDTIDLPPDAAIPDFTSNVISGNVPLDVAFTGTSSGGQVDNWMWDFGDNQTSSLQSPAHTYTSRGNYSVSLAVTNNSAGTESMNYDNMIRAGFTVVPITIGSYNSSLNLSQGDIIRLQWNNCRSCREIWDVSLTSGLNRINDTPPAIITSTSPSPGGGVSNIWDIVATNRGEQTISAINVGGLPGAFTLNILVN